MKHCFFWVALAFAVLSGAGCDSMPTRVRERFETPQPKTRVFHAEVRAVFEAAQVAMRDIDFQVSRAAFAQGMVNGNSRILPGASFGTGRQYAMDVRFREVDAGQTEVALVLHEQEESPAFSGATDRPLRDHALYEAFFSALERALGAPTRPPEPPAK